MKKILIIILITSFAISTHAASLVPNLQTQMKKQEVVNKQKTALDKKLAIQERKKQNAQKVATLRSNRQTVLAQKIASKSNTIAAATVSTGTKATVTPVIQKATNVASTTVISSSTQSQIPGVDIHRVRSTWLSWYNAGRAAKGLGAYNYDSRLDSTAHDWNIVFAGSRGTNFHERSPGDGYYNYPIINKWFQTRGVNPPVISGVNHSENVSYGYYACSKSDCTEDLINTIHSSYRFFINSPVHARSVFQPNFTKIGFDIVVVPSERRYYVTVHYMTR